MKPTRIVIVGGGVAGILLATKLGKQLGHSGKADVVLVDSAASHVWKPMLHTIAAGTRDLQQQQVIYLAHAREHGYTYQPGEMRGLDRSRKEIELDAIRSSDGQVFVEQRALTYDVLILSVGSQANDFGTPGVRDHCYFIDSQKQALLFNEALRMNVYRSVVRDESLRVAIVGGGATGVELSAELSRLLEVASAYGDRYVRERLNLTLLESGPRLLSAFPPSISASTQQRLEEIGLAVKTSTCIKSAERDGFRNEAGEIIKADLMVWAAGVMAPAFLGGIGGLKTNRANQIVVTPTLQSTEDDNVFALGDCASFTPSIEGRGLPPTAQVATQQAEHLSKHLPQWLEGCPLPAFVFRDFGSLVSISDYDAIGTVGPAGLFRGALIRGRLAQIGHRMLYRRHQRAMHGLRKATLLWTAERINRLVQPKIRLV